MKIEKINDRQIRCYLTSKDLADRKVKLSEIAYGSEKAKQLFRDMLDLAERECGFEGKDTPIMVEAIPSPPDELVLVITKVDNPDELDVRFSRFTPSDSDSDGTQENSDENPDGIFGKNVIEQAGAGDVDAADAIKGILDRVFGGNDNGTDGKKEPEKQEIKIPADYFRTFRFTTLEKTAEFARAAGIGFAGPSKLYKNPADGKYYLTIGIKNADRDVFRKLCNRACEFGEEAPEAKMSYYTEHCKCIIKSDALGILSVFM